MNTQAIINILTTAAAEGTRKPCVFDRIRLLGVKSDLENCKNIQEILLILTRNKPFLLTAFGVNIKQFDNVIRLIKDEQ